MNLHFLRKQNSKDILEKKYFFLKKWLWLLMSDALASWHLVMIRSLPWFVQLIWGWKPCREVTLAAMVTYSDFSSRKFPWPKWHATETLGSESQSCKYGFESDGQPESCTCAAQFPQMTERPLRALRGGAVLTQCSGTQWIKSFCILSLFLCFTCLSFFPL